VAVDDTEDGRFDRYAIDDGIGYSALAKRDGMRV
jgi:hypothetical protein